MSDEKLLKRIMRAVEARPEDVTAHKDLYYMCLDTLKDDPQLALRYLLPLSALMEHHIPKMSTVEVMQKMYDLHKDILRTLAPYDFDSYMLFMEWNREPAKKFYKPRRKILRQVVDALQRLEDDPTLDLVSISLPPGVGKTTLAIFYLSWIAGKHPDEPNLTGSHSNAFIRGVYDEVLRMTDPAGEYLWHDVFPGVRQVSTNAKDCRIDFGTSKRFETLEFTSIGTGNAGLYRAQHLLYCDDLVSGIEVALSIDRLDKLWEIYTTDLRQRKLGDHCKELHIATRWSVHDVIGRLEQEYGDSGRAIFIAVPALDENDESNFDYAFGVGFSTKVYHEQRDIMDEVSWRALYQNEPIEREGLVYHPDELRRFFELPNESPDSIIGVCDTKDKGDDYAFLPVAYVYGQDYYISDCICDNGLPDAVNTRLANILVNDKVVSCRFESNSAGRVVSENVQKEVKSRGGFTHITTKYTTANKITKIISYSPFVKEHFLFKDKSMYKKNSDYGKMMDMLCTYTMAGKNKHDDVPDGMAMLADYAQSLCGAKTTVFARPF